MTAKRASTVRRKSTGKRKRDISSVTYKSRMCLELPAISEGGKPSLYQLAYGGCLADEGKD